jgi:hypothetical protein
VAASRVAYAQDVDAAREPVATPRAAEAIGSSGRHHAGLVDPRTRGFLIVLPSDEGLRELHLIGPRGYHAREVLPPGSTQCGYGTTIFGNLL